MSAPDRTSARRILMLNPNTSVSMTERLHAVAQAAAAPDVTVEALTATRGFPYIASHAEAQVGGAVALECIATRLEREASDGRVDAVVVAAFGDPGVKAARELFDLPVVGMAAAAAVSAALLGERFAIVTFTPLMSRWYLDCIDGIGLAARCTGVRSPPRRALDVDTAAESMADELAALARRCVVEDGADVVILGGAPLAGLAPRLQPAVPAPLIDPIAVAIGQAETLARCTARDALRSRHGRPAAKPSNGLVPALARAVGDFRDGDGSGGDGTASDGGERHGGHGAGDGRSGVDEGDGP